MRLRSFTHIKLNDYYIMRVSAVIKLHIYLQHNTQLLYYLQES